MNIPWDIIIVSLIFIACFVQQRAREKSDWNNGVSRFNGQRWMLCDTSSSGDREYTDGKNYIWISYNVDKRNNTKLSHKEGGKEKL